ncbi:thiol-disulfide isomerase/thioredoxin [Epilithonimonas hungarica]|uniref:TlpA family protein disulfide reductase n=1 Tax=Epilithonimonas hungarica TaxID=454006 RepID=UPI002784AA57|nr:thioredoxin domain-containing protein [Epilithonimonas hungarica]MDP9955696.1 thiol-disulfide isomerase/thioredoxin [Epilithonimonas hungarica]
MKKFLIYSVLSLILLACKKNDEKVAEAEAKEDSIKVEPTKSEADVAKLTELSPEKITEVLKSNHSDTLYVTNFFATWCGPCMQEIPHFRKKMEELTNQPVKFTFVSLDNKTDWATDVSDFADEYDIRNNVILLDGMLLKEDFFKQNFQSWNGEAIPFTLIRKGDKSDETVGSMTEEMLNQKIEKLLANNTSAKVIDNKEKAMISSPKKSLK